MSTIEAVYWGVIISSVSAGIASLALLNTIHHNQKSKLNVVLPILAFEMIDETKVDFVWLIDFYQGQFDSSDRKEKPSCWIKVTNVGVGTMVNFRSNGSWGDGTRMTHLIANESKVLGLIIDLKDKNHDLNFEYTDIYGNKYQQSITVLANHKNKSFEFNQAKIKNCFLRKMFEKINISIFRSLKNFVNSFRKYKLRTPWEKREEEVIVEVEDIRANRNSERHVTKFRNLEKKN